MLVPSLELLNTYQNALGKAGIGVCELDIATGVVTWDESYRKLYEFDEGVFQGRGQDLKSMVHEDDFDSLKSYMDELVLNGLGCSTICRVCFPNGRIKYIRVSMSKVTNSQKEQKIVSLSWEISTQWALQLDLIKEKKFSESILDAIPDPIFVKNEKHQVIYANSEYEKFVGMKKAEFVGKDDYDFFPKEMADYFWKRNEEVFKSNQSEETNEQVFDSQGRQRDVLTKKTPLKISSGEKNLVGVIRDITDLKNIQTSMIEQSKMASLGEMAAGIGHEINNPLSIIQGKAQLLQEKINNNMINFENCKKDLEQIELNCVRIDKIIKSLKSVSRKADLDPFEETPLMRLIDEVFEISKERFRKKSLNLFVESDEAVKYAYKAMVRPSEIVQVLVNLLNNAFDAIQGHSEGWARVKLTKLQNHLQVEVIDSGSEINPDVVAKMMQPFFTTKSTGKGTGLGLSVSRQIIQNHSGDLFFDVQAANTRFVFTLPKIS
jgi:PAS domain S-box-containing protein